MEGSIGELQGRITKLIQPFPKNAHVGECIFETKTASRSWNCICQHFFPIDVGDVINGIGQIQSHPTMGQIIMLIRPPFVELAADRDTLIRIFLKVLRGTGFGVTKANQLYDTMHSLSERENSTLKASVSDYIARLTFLWRKTQDEGLFHSLQHLVTTGQMKKLCYFWYQNRELRRLWLLGLSTKEIQSSRLSTEELYKRCLTNPYTVVCLSMDKCRNILARRGLEANEEQIMCGTIMRKIYDNMIQRGWTCTPVRALQALYPLFEQVRPILEAEYGLKTELDMAYIDIAYTVETKVLERINALLQAPCIHSKSLSQEKGFIYKRKDLTDEQKLAVKLALESNVSILRGLAGSGKTNVILEIIYNLEHRDIPYAVASFTGKAVYRLKEVIGKDEPATLHRMIATARQRKPFRHLIIDEASMVTTELMYEFFETFKAGAKGQPFAITFVGDPNQLEPISWGSLFSELVRSNIVPTMTLTINHRLEKTNNGAENGIAINANAIATYDIDDDVPFQVTPSEDFQMVYGDVEQVYDILRALYQAAIPASDITVITPYNKELPALNSTFQQIYNDGFRFATDSRQKTWMIKDRVICIKNMYNVNLYNGEEGQVSDIQGPDDAKHIVVKFRGGIQHQFLLEKRNVLEGVERKKPVKTVQRAGDMVFDDPEDDEEEELNVMQLEHAFAYTTHKSQGSEWPYVIFYLPKSPANANFLSKNLVYTSITRAKRAIWIVTPDLETFVCGATRPSAQRYDGLAKRLTTIQAKPPPDTLDSEIVDLEA